MTFSHKAPDLEGQLVRLRQLNADYLEDYIALIGDEEVRSWTGTTQPFDSEQLLTWLATRPDASDRFDWAILEGSTGEFLGEIVLTEFDSKTQSMNMRIAIKAQATSKGFGTETLQLVVHYAFGTLALDSVTLEVLQGNQRAIRSYEKAGFVPVDTFEEGNDVFILMEVRNTLR